MRRPEPIFITDLFPPLYDELFALLARLCDEDWRRPTVASRWNVKDVAAHLLDGDIRRLSFQRDAEPLTAPRTPITGYRSLVDHLDALNAVWTTAAERMSPRIIVDFLRVTGPQICDLFARLDPYDTALFGVAWAGEEVSANWFDIAREYTEKWHHQQQIRAAVGMPGLVDRLWVRPFLDTMVRGLPHAFRESRAAEGSSVLLDIVGDGGGAWTLVREKNQWELYVGTTPHPTTTVQLRDGIAWRLFSKMLPPAQARNEIELSGDERLGAPLLGYVGFMV